ncbi:hypothetical protein [Thermicanus aegyptius]|uniref:hypothetical protein n=1 Tax=Thermicanus aegyptius TaxID=94009 RepID=UPI00040CFB05|nr:hypothetical protein [Thermicanus aegyptius]
MRINLWLLWQPWQKKVFKKLTSPYGLAEFDWDEPYWGETFFSNSRKFKKLIERAQKRGWIYLRIPYPQVHIYPRQQKIVEYSVHYLRRPDSPDIPILNKATPVFIKSIRWKLRHQDEKYLRKSENVLVLIAKGELASAEQLLEDIEAEMILEVI